MKYISDELNIFAYKCGCFICSLDHVFQQFQPKGNKSSQYDNNNACNSIGDGENHLKVV